MMRQRHGRETISIERGPHPVGGNCVAFALAARTPVSPFETAKNHRVARKVAARQYLIPFLLSFSVSPFSSLHPFFFHWSLYTLLYSIPSLAATLSRTLHILPLPYQVLLDSPLLAALSIRSLIKYICLTRTRASTHI